MSWNVRLFGTRRRLALCAGAVTVASLAVGAAANHWIRTSSTDVGVNLIVIVGWVASMMAAAVAQALLAADVLWGERWRRRALLGWVPDADEMEPEDIKDRSWMLYALMAGLLLLGYAGNGALNGNFFGWYQFRGFALVQLRSDEPEQRLEALLELADHQDPTIVAKLTERIHDPDPTVRAEALGVMGDKRVESVRPDLFRALEGADPTVRATAAEALGKIRGQGVLQALTGLLSREEEPVLRRGVIAGLGLLGDPAAGPVLAGVLASSNQDDIVRAGAAWALGELRTEVARVALAEALAPSLEGAPATRCAALHALAKVAGGKSGGAATKPPPAIVKAFSANPGELGHDCDRTLVSERARRHCFGKLNRPSSVAYEGDCIRYQTSSPEAFRIKALRAAVRASGKSAMHWLAEVNNDKGEPAAIRSWAADLYLRLKAL